MEKSNLIWLTNKFREKEVLLDKFTENKFRVLEFGKFMPILHDGNLIENSVAEILQKYVPEQIELIKNVIIWRKSTDENWDNYSEIRIKNHLNLKNFKNAKFDGLRIYNLMYSQIYISPELKDKIVAECEKEKELDFINEWPMYA